MNKKKPFRIFFVYLVASIPFLRCLWELSKGLEYLIHSRLLDDAFYYFEIAKHFPYANVNIPHSGFHPLFALINIPLHRYLAPYPAISLSLIILALSLSISTILMFKLLSEFWEFPIPVVVSSIWGLNGTTYEIATLGVETIIAVTFILGFYLLFVRLLKANIAQTEATQYVFLGLLGGIAFWARMDAPLILAPAVTYLSWQLIKQRDQIKLLALILPFCILPLIWITYIYRLTGSPFPTSGEALRVHKGLHETTILPLNQMATIFLKLVNNAAHFIIDGSIPAKLCALGIAGLLCSLSLRALVQNQLPTLKTRPVTVVFLVSLFSGLALWSSYYIFLQGRIRYWYMAYIGLGMHTVIMPLSVASLTKFCTKKIAYALGVSLIVAIPIFTWPSSTSPQAYDKYHSAKAAQKILTGRDIKGAIGSFNSGIYDYFMTRDVINLDGVVNAEALHAWKSKTFYKYLKRKNIKYLIEVDNRKFRHFRDTEGVEAVKWIDLTAHYNPYSQSYYENTFLWKLKLSKN